MDLRLSARLGAFACLGVAAGMTVLSLREEPKPAPVTITPSTDLPTDPLPAKLRSCQLAGQAAGSDPGCLAAWAENRRRFLGQRPQPPAEPVVETGPGRSTEPVIVLDDADAHQEQ